MKQKHRDKVIRTPPLSSLIRSLSALAGLAAFTLVQAQPAIQNVYPDGSRLFQVSPTLAFNATATAGVTNVTVQLTSTTLPGVSRLRTLTLANGLTATGPASNLSVSATLQSNRVYSAAIQVQDANGQSASATVSFDTIVPVYTFEAEDYDYNSGQFIDNPQTNAYRGLIAVDGVDAHNGSGGAQDYRPHDPTTGGLATEGCGDKPRAPYIGTGQQDYDVGWNNGGNWANYTRTYPTGTFNIYMRGANPNGASANSASLAGSLSGPLGRFSVPNTGGWQTYTWVPLKDAGGNLVQYTGGGVETLRLDTVDGNYNANFYLLMPADTNAAVVAPTITNAYPDGVYQFEQTNTFSFEVISPVGVNQGDIAVQLNGTNLLGQGSMQVLTPGTGLTVTGTANDWIVTTPLTTNTVYKAVIQATDLNGDTGSSTITFDTVSPAYYTFEAEDFDYTDVSGTSGLFFDNPQTNAYASLNSAPSIDFFLNGSAVRFAYRGSATTALNQENAGDKKRPQYDGGLSDYDLGNANNGDWANYTRTFPAGTYNIYLRSASGGGGGVCSLSLVTSGVGTSNQTLTTLGTFAVPGTGGWQTYTWVPCKDAGGNLAQFTGGSVKTLRFTNGGGNNASYFMLVPADTTLPTITGLYPDGSSWYQYTNALSFVASSSAGIAQTGVVVTVDGTVASGLVFSGSTTSWTVRYPNLRLNAAHSVGISVTASNGFNKTVTVSFDTFKPGYYTWEAEDYDYGGGQFYDNPQVDSYAGLPSTPDVDNHQSDLNPGRTFAYRPESPAPSTTVAGDTSRPFTGTDYNIGFFGGGSWVNFTRHYPAGTYNVWGRFAEGASASQLDLAQLTSGYGTTNQTTKPLGTFFIPVTGWSTWEWTPLKDSNGNLATLTLDGSQATLKLLGSPVGGLPEVNVNFLMLVPSGAITLKAARAGTTNTISFQTQTGFTYQLQYKNSLTDPTWTPLAGPIPGDNTVHSLIDSAPGSSRFYRAQVSWQP